MPNESTSYQNLLETIKTIVAVPNKLTTLRTAETKALKQCEQKSQEKLELRKGSIGKEWGVFS